MKGVVIMGKRNNENRGGLHLRNCGCYLISMLAVIILCCMPLKVNAAKWDKVTLEYNHDNRLSGLLPSTGDTFTAYFYNTEDEDSIVTCNGKYTGSLVSGIDGFMTDWGTYEKRGSFRDGVDTQIAYTLHVEGVIKQSGTTNLYFKVPVPPNCDESSAVAVNTTTAHDNGLEYTVSETDDNDGYVLVTTKMTINPDDSSIGKSVYIFNDASVDYHMHYTLHNFGYDSTSHWRYCDTDGEIFAKEAHEFDESGQCYCGYTKGADGSSTGTPASEGTSLTDKSGNSTGFEVTNSDSANATVAYEGTTADSSKTSITIPDTVTDASGNVYKVTEIKAGALKNNKKLKSVTIGSNVETIGSSAFEGCENLKTIKMGSNVEKIGSKAFKNCKKLTKVTLPSTVTEIGSNAFSGDSKLSSITISTKSLKKVGKNALKGIKSTATIKLKGTKKQKAAAKKKITKSKTGYKSSMKIK
ncbi:MAG: leucine-rich repeat domain-containing protein [Butyrivibrio sp.]|nr:leucine-rich repeat domain-containing protein [Butyrivibrio sp.]